MPPRRLADARGFTIIETMAATLILAVAFLGLAGVQAVSSRAQSLGKNHGLATFVSDRQLELMRRSSFAAIAAYTGSEVVEGVTFNVARTVTDVGMAKRVAVTTSWTDRFGPRSVTLTTLVSQVTNP
jgi:prepilin-type N-terminal cleavage/methylation domain-containing protein